MLRNAIVTTLVLLFACTGDELPPPSSPRDPANPHAPETKFDPGMNPLLRQVPPPPGSNAPESAGHAGHGGSTPAMSASSAANPHAGHQMAPPQSSSSTPPPAPVNMPMNMPTPKAP